MTIMELTQILTNKGMTLREAEQAVRMALRLMREARPPKRRPVIEVPLNRALALARALVDTPLAGVA